MFVRRMFYQNDLRDLTSKQKGLFLDWKEVKNRDLMFIVHNQVKSLVSHSLAK